MLDKIINIKAAPSYQKERGVYNNGERTNLEKILAVAVKNSQGTKDSIKFSPAAHYLGRISWHLKDLAFDNDGGKLLLAFSTGGYDFNTEVDFLKFHTTMRQFYEITGARILNSKKVTARVRISAAKKSKALQDEKAALNFPGLDDLFNRVYSLELSGEIDKYYSAALPELMDGIKETLIAEFDYINGALFTLIDRISPGKLAPNYVFGSDRNEPIIIEKIKALND